MVRLWSLRNIHFMDAILKTWRLKFFFQSGHIKSNFTMGIRILNSESSYHMLLSNFIWYEFDIKIKLWLLSIDLCFYSELYFSVVALSMWLREIFHLCLLSWQSHSLTQWPGPLRQGRAHPLTTWTAWQHPLQAVYIGIRSLTTQKSLRILMPKVRCRIVDMHRCW